MKYTVREAGIKHTVEAAYASEDLDGKVTFLDSQGGTIAVFDKPQEWYKQTRKEEAARDEVRKTETRG